MWTLLIISTVIGLDEPKVTTYAEFDTKHECYVEWYNLTEAFTQGETAWCEGPK